MTTFNQFTVEPSTSGFTELLTSTNGAVVTNLGPETVYLYNGYGSEPTFSATTWYALYPVQSVSFSGGTGGLQVLAATVAGSSQVNVVSTS